MKIINRELLKQFSEYISEISIYTLFMRYGQEHFNDKGEYKDELESSARTESETS